MESSLASSKAIPLFEFSAIACGLKLICKKTGVNLWKLYKLLKVKATKAPTRTCCELTDSFSVTADFWLVELLFLHVRNSLRDCDWMKEFSYGVFMRSTLPEILREYETKLYSVICVNLYLQSAASVPAPHLTAFRNRHLLRFPCIFLDICADKRVHKFIPVYAFTRTVHEFLTMSSRFYILS